MIENGSAAASMDVAAGENTRLPTGGGILLAGLGYLSDQAAASYIGTSIAAVRAWRASSPARRLVRPGSLCADRAAGLSPNSYHLNDSAVRQAAQVASRDLHLRSMRILDRVAAQRKITRAEAAFAMGMRP